MPIPAGTKFHGVAPSVDTENRGSSNANADRDAYAIEDFNGTSFQAYLMGSGQEVLWDTIVKLGPESPDNNTGFPTVGSTNAPPNYLYRDYVFNRDPVGIVMAGATKGSTVEVVVQGHQTKAKVFYYEGVTPDRGDNLYASTGGSIAGGQVDFGDYMAVGQVTGIDPVLVIDYGIYGAVWEVQAYYSLPAESSYYIDGIKYQSSVRQNCEGLAPDCAIGDIVKIAIPNSQTEGRIQVTRVEASDPIEAFVGIATDFRKSPGSQPTDYVLKPDMVCMSGNVFLPAWTINGPAPVQGGLIYVDATTPHKLTTDSTSGTVVGLVQALDENPEDGLERVLIQVKL